MARPSVGDFESEDQALLKQHSKPKQPFIGLLPWAKSNNIPINSAYRTPEHNRKVGGVANSYHTRGTPDDPQALDIPPAYIAQARRDLTRLGFEVIDEGDHGHIEPGPKFHLQKAGGTATPSAAGLQPVAGTSSLAPVEITPARPFELGRRFGHPLETGADGTLQRAKQNTYDIQAEINKNVKPLDAANSKIAAKAAEAVSLDDFESEDRESLEAVVDRLRKPPPSEVQLPVSPEAPPFLEGMGRLGQAGLEFVKSVPGQIGQGFQREFNTFQQNPMAGLERQLTAGPQAVEGIRNLFQAPADLSAAIGNIYLGREEYVPGYTLPTTRDIPTPFGKTLGQIYDEHPVTGFVAENAIPVEGLVGLGAKALRGAKLANSVPVDHLPAYGFKGQDGQLLFKSDYEPRPQTTLEPVNTPEQTAELRQAFEQRTRPDAQQIITPAQQDLPGYKPETLESGLVVAKRESSRPAPEDVPEIIRATDPFSPKSDIKNDIVDAYETPLRAASVEKAQSLNAALGETVGKFLDDAEASDAVPAFDMLESLGYTVNRISKANKGADAGIEYSVKIGEQTLRFKGDESIAGFVRRNNIGPETLVRSANARETVDKLLDLIPDNTGKHRYAEAKARLEVAGREAAEAARYEAMEAKAQRFIDDAGQVETMQQLDELADAAVRETGNSPAFETVLKALDDAETRLARPTVTEGYPAAKPFKSDTGLEIPGQPKPTGDTGLIVPGRQLATQKTPASTPKATPELPQQATEGTGHLLRENATPEEAAQIQKDLADATIAGDQPISIAESLKLVKDHGRDPQHLLTAIEAGKLNQTFSFDTAALESGRKDLRVREIHPVAVMKSTIKPETHLNNLKKEFGTYDAVRDHLIQKLRQYGTDVQTVGNPQPKTLVPLIKQLDAASGGRELTDIRIYGYNLGESSRSSSGIRGYRLDSIKRSSLTGKAQAIGGQKYQNQIAPAMKMLESISQHPDAPAGLKRIVSQIKTGKVSKQSYTQLKALMRDMPRSVREIICKL